MKFYDIKNLIAKAIEEADKAPCPEGYANANGWEGNQSDWLSDWSAFLTDAVVAKLESHGLAIRGRFVCTSCGKFFVTQKDKDRHRNEVHTPYLKLSSKDRPAELGDVACGHCEQSFANEWNAMQHRRAVHGIP